MSGFLQRLLRKAPSANYLWREITVRPYDLLPPNPVILDIGARKAKGRYFFGAPPADARLTCVDIEPGPNVDIVADAHDLSPIPDNYADCLVAVGMLLHCRYPNQVLSEFYRVLKPGGILYVGAPYVSPHPHFPPVFYHFTVQGLEATCERFEKLDSGFNRGPGSATAQVLVTFFAILFSFNNSRFFSVSQYAGRWLLSWVKYFDVFLPRMRRADLLYTGTYFIGRKPGA